MSRRNRHLVVLLVAVVTASLASFGVYRAMAGMPGDQATPSQVPVVVAARALPLGTPLTERDVKVVSWPSSSVVPGAIGNVRDVVNRGLLASVLQNEPLTNSKLAAANSGAGLPPAIPPGMRAMSVKVNDVIGVAGFIVPGSRVDVVVTIRRSEDTMTSTVASNVQVLTAGTRQDQEAPKTTETKATEATVVTLMVTPQDAERIALAQTEGQIMLALRNPLDHEPTVTTGARAASLLGQPTPAPQPEPKAPAPARRRVVEAPPPAPVVEAPPPPRTVEAIRAAKRSEEVIR